MVTKIFVGGISFDVDDQKLQALFAEFGTVESAVIIKDRDNGRSKGFGFVEMASADAQKAIAALNGKDVGGRKLTVNQARPKEDRR